MTGSLRSDAQDTVLRGTPVVPGVGFGPVIRPGRRPEVPTDTTVVDDAARGEELERFRTAAATVAARLRGRAELATGAASEVLSANAAMAQDRGWLGAAEKLISKGTRATAATEAATQQIATMFEKLGGLMAERVTDLRDIRDRVVAEILGVDEPGVPVPTEPSILFADDLAPADTAGLDATLVVGLATSLGGPTSHTAIIARQLGIPCIVAVAGLDDVPAGTTAMVDGTTGDVVLDPNADDAARLVADAKAELARVSGWSGPGATADGHPVDILANVQDGAGARAARSSAADGVGLFRTELCFLDRDAEPTVDEQAAIYGEVLEAFAGHKVVVRTLDAGSDKPLRFANHADEANPALGVRGIRIAEQDRGILYRQLDGIAAAAKATGSNPWVMAPMIATAAEAAAFAADVRERGLKPGVMIEVPAAALLAEHILEHVDFLSIGTNDLAQYTMAADRMSSQLAALTDPWQPAVLALVSHTAKAGAAAGKPVGVCGEAAADPLLACVLVGLGITSLSAASAAVAHVGAKLSTVTFDKCVEAADAALRADSASAARAAVAAILN
ncbi:phosphoenolpyruvate--protein phosphotransferase [Rhodococcus sp. BP-252]|uniref:phosphoenolpyruvate--protein phosphotransferase n=1 Tax=unclassified Rhodococcus (in: high G+C Gram-positive bacteria) TaxID=192944 RepID=UPI00142FC6F5|nr:MULTISPECIES: phosphoenolpyruvate--protein phosphotransferase [unclassified Rhodococcus (in: high G+C Gram-positive bacteria)]NIL75653.1 Phosphoenolpyruvate-protein phosphotransferase [Rhodococcus sp. B10]MBY6410983.1 phosphoenolpyruvate--protein phosphotransferase [Rhodococcus sp. BP-320]MBY6415642.1 phosphoenolpyruvate--protein phosphotransferase [Rhodococcus sp. BP-321]MBY6420976.1 phosphoenolpyruvate--protein phosphotransferase [Rhodococcus sp. BP-324]MBY6426031.1 phosphoenolpyruvate--p